MSEAKLSMINVLEDRLASAMQASDVQVLGELIDDDLVFTNHEGLLVSKKQDIDVHASGLLKIEELISSDRAIRHFGDFAVVTVLAQVTGSYAGTPFAGRFRFTRVWALRHSRWQIVAVHSTAVAN
jgi:ketosteroid isomerase-like protein